MNKYKFNKSGKFGLNLGRDGVINVKKDEIVELSNEHAQHWLQKGICEPAEVAPKKATKELDAEVKKAKAEDEEKAAPKKKGRRKKAK